MKNNAVPTQCISKKQTFKSPKFYPCQRLSLVLTLKKYIFEGWNFETHKKIEYFEHVVTNCNGPSSFFWVAEI